MSATNCKGCGAPIEQPKGRGRPRIWCSDRCRKETLYAGTCEQCGATTSGDGGKRRAPKSCIRCTRNRNQERNAEIFRLNEEGAPHWYIAEQMGCSRAQVSRTLDYYRREKGKPIAMHRLGGDADARRKRRKLVAEMARGGYTNAEIAEMIGTSPGSVGQMVYDMRRRGEDIPYPRPQRKVAA